MAQRYGGTPARRLPPVLSVSALLIGALAAVTACGADEDSGAPAPPGAAGASHSAASASRPGAAEPGARAHDSGRASTPAKAPSAAKPSVATEGASGAPPAARRICSEDQLKLSAGRADFGAGNVYVPLAFTNTGETSCTLTGFPGVSLLDTPGTAIGGPAARRGPARPTVVLKPGDSAYASLHTLNKGLSDKPCWRTASEIRAYPPDSYRSMKTSARSFQVCGEVFEVTALEPGSEP
ncbi:hypothetical protein SBI_02128 [Streptomyces bingchenggensis BCW-1]|uniref:DUF4232 domain-containing protein n=1 Tax=Streptomyces bingchenggensis (strain BCW-1) TaxID=749414 RepID=D7BT34_STRBB|nr:MULTISPECIES: DUF4232 domain-containing protein [Streptomyces]ADI05249.1 hypothetical protein SBI_02128 [Streptomyces bingchenggensis BCW-1]